MHAITTAERNRHFLEVVNPGLSRLARRIVEASGMQDPVLGESRFQDLVNFYHEQVRLGYWHPGLTETMADYTAIRAPETSLGYYRLALQQARELDWDAYTILISMAQALFELGQREQAEACLRDGRAEAIRCGDDYYVQEADRVSRETTA
jgi:hypothetical protein